MAPAVQGPTCVCSHKIEAPELSMTLHRPQRLALILQLLGKEGRHCRQSKVGLRSL